MAEAKLAFGVAAELEPAVMQEEMVGGAEQQAVAARVLAAFTPSDDMVHVDVTAPVATAHAAPAAVAQVLASARRARDPPPMLSMQFVPHRAALSRNR